MATTVTVSEKEKQLGNKSKKLVPAPPNAWFRAPDFWRLEYASLAKTPLVSWMRLPSVESHNGVNKSTKRSSSTQPQHDPISAPSVSPNTIPLFPLEQAVPAAASQPATQPATSDMLQEELQRLRRAVQAAEQRLQEQIKHQQEELDRLHRELNLKDYIIEAMKQQVSAMKEQLHPREASLPPISDIDTAARSQVTDHHLPTLEELSLAADLRRKRIRDSPPSDGESDEFDEESDTLSRPTKRARTSVAELCV